eukprot:gnl/MRDRNA2_/MRDRNA2_102073_c0_seq1.p1 gnl/MRDRNA2_/MRDRNA2_102073_c0~~gnl/MRDRNA2_/MRDRNA2_102073_c0_seq1.p1  ORF type:complete len:218 (+),score=45.36 gnl/MRDRNA2_/MRDRNA2_102073_c0_seq1:94-747(+)
MAFGLWVNVAIVMGLTSTRCAASRIQEHSLRHTVLNKEFLLAHLSQTASLGNQTKDTVVVKGLSAAGKDALHKIIQDLSRIGFGVKREPEESKGEFMSKCLAHVNELVHTLDRAYTDIQLETVLENECQLSQQFPKTHDNNFQSHEACMAFSAKLAKARRKELDTGSTTQYKDFCTQYYEHVDTGAMPKEKEETHGRHSAAATAGFTMGALCAALMY